MPKEQVVRYWSLLDVSVIHLRKTELFSTIIPSKLFEGMGIPVLHGVPGESRIVREEGVGATFESGDAAGLAAPVLSVFRDPGRLTQWRSAALDAARRYERPALAGSMLSALESWAASSR